MSYSFPLSGAFPGLTFNPTEASSTYFEEREVSGVYYRAQNATFNGTHWSLVSSGSPAYATAQLLDGSIAHYSMPHGSSPWVTWGGSGNGQARVFNVRDYGAGLGLADDSIPINLATTDAGNAGGGIVYLPAGVYKIQNLIKLQNNTTLLGDGFAFTMIEANGPLNGGTIAIMVANGHWSSAGSSIVNTNIYIRGISFNCGGATYPPAAQGPILLAQVQNCGVMDCEIYNSTTHGILVTGQSQGGLWPATTDINFQILRNHINLNWTPSGPTTTAGVFPIRAEGALWGTIQGNVIGDLMKISSGGPYLQTNDAIDFPGSCHIVCCDNYVTMCNDGMGTNASFDVVFANNRIDAPQGFGISTFSAGGGGLDGVSDVTITGNIITNATNTGIRVSSPNNAGGSVATGFAVTGNVIEFSPNGIGPSGIHIEAKNGTVTGNSIDLGGTNLAGISIDPSQSVGSGMNGGNHVTCSGNTIANGSGPGGTSIGLRIPSGSGNSVRSVSISDNNVDAATIQDPISLPALSNVITSAIRNNLGANPYAPGVPSPTVPVTSGTPVTNSYPFDVDVYVSGGTVSGISVNGQATLLTSGSFFVETGGSITWNGAARPNWVWVCR